MNAQVVSDVDRDLSDLTQLLRCTMDVSRRSCRSLDRQYFESSKMDDACCSEPNGRTQQASSRRYRFALFAREHDLFFREIRGLVGVVSVVDLIVVRTFDHR